MWLDIHLHLIKKTRTAKAHHWFIDIYIGLYILSYNICIVKALLILILHWGSLNIVVDTDWYLRQTEDPHGHSVPDGLFHRLSDNVWRGSRLGEGCEADNPFHRFIVFTTGAQQVKKCGQENHLCIQRNNEYLKPPLNSNPINLIVCVCVCITRDRAKLSSAVPLWNSTESSVVVVDISKPTFRLITTHRDSNI